MSPVTVVGSPDYQHGITTAQKLLGTFTSAQASATVSVPPNAETIVVMADSATPLTMLSCVGATTGYSYPISVSYLNNGGVNEAQYFINASGQVDAQLVLTWVTAPSAGWSVYSDQAPHVSFDPNLGLLVNERESPLGAWGVLLLGTDTVNQHALETDSNGRQIPLVPTGTTGALAVSAANNLFLAAPPSGAYYLFGLDIRNGAASYTAVVLQTVAQVAYAHANVPVGDSRHIELNGLRVTTQVNAIASQVGATMVLRFAAGP